MAEHFFQSLTAKKIQAVHRNTITMYSLTALQPLLSNPQLKLLKIPVRIHFLDHCPKSLELILKALIPSLDITDLIHHRISLCCKTCDHKGRPCP